MTNWRRIPELPSTIQNDLPPFDGKVYLLAFLDFLSDPDLVGNSYWIYSGKWVSKPESKKEGWAALTKMPKLPMAITPSFWAPLPKDNEPGWLVGTKLSNLIKAYETYPLDKKFLVHIKHTSNEKWIEIKYSVKHGCWRSPDKKLWQRSSYAKKIKGYSIESYSKIVKGYLIDNLPDNSEATLKNNDQNLNLPPPLWG